MITEEYRDELDALLSRAVTNDDKLSQWESDFVGDLAKRLELYDCALRISPKQQDILDRIKQKLDEAGA